MIFFVMSQPTKSTPFLHPKVIKRNSHNTDYDFSPMYANVHKLYEDVPYCKNSVCYQILSTKYKFVVLIDQRRKHKEITVFWTAGNNAILLI